MSLGQIDGLSIPEEIFKFYLGIELTEENPCIEVSIEKETYKLGIQKLLPHIYKETQITYQLHLFDLIINKLQGKIFAPSILADFPSDILPKANAIFSQVMKTILDNKVAIKSVQTHRDKVAKALEEHVLKNIKPFMSSVLDADEKESSKEIKIIKPISVGRNRRMSMGNLRTKELIEIEKPTLIVPSISDLVLTPHTPKLLSPNTKEDIQSHLENLRYLESRYKNEISIMSDDCIQFCRTFWNEIFAKGLKKDEKKYKELKKKSDYAPVKKKGLILKPLMGLCLQEQICRCLKILPEPEELARDIGRQMQFATITNDELEMLCSLLKITPRTLKKDDEYFALQSAHFLKILKIFINNFGLENEDSLRKIDEDWGAIVEEEKKTISNDSFEFACAALLKRIFKAESLKVQKLGYALATLNQQMYVIPGSAVTLALPNIEYIKGEKNTKFRYSFSNDEIQLLVQKNAVPTPGGGMPRFRMVIENRLISRLKHFPSWTSEVKIKIYSYPGYDNSKIRELVVEPLRKLGLRVESFANIHK